MLYLLLIRPRPTIIILLYRTPGSPGFNPDWKNATLALNFLQKCMQPGRFNTIGLPQYLRRLNLLPQNPTLAPEISQTKPW